MEQKIINPLTLEVVNTNSQEGKDILFLNSLCERCPKGSIFSIKSNKCLPAKHRKGDLADKLKYCEAYHLQKEKLLESQIVKNILDIKIPKEIAGKAGIASLKIRDFNNLNIKKYNFLNFNVAEKLGIVNQKTQTFINRSVVVLFTLMNISLSSEAVRNFLIASIGKGLKGLGKGMMTRIFDTTKNPILRTLLSSLSSKKLWVFITGLFTTLSYLPFSKVTKQNTDKIAATVLTGTSMPVRHVLVNEARNYMKKLSNLQPYDIKILRDHLHESFNEDSMELNLYSSGLNTEEIQSAARMSFGFDRKENVPYVDLAFVSGKQMKKILIYPEQQRIKIINKVNSDISNFSDSISEDINNIEKLLESHTVYSEIKKTSNEIIDIQKVLKETENNAEGRKRKLQLKKQKFSLEKRLKTLKSNKGGKISYVPQDIIHKNETLLRHLINLQDSIRKFKIEELSKIEPSNVNAHLPYIISFIDETMKHLSVLRSGIQLPTNNKQMDLEKHRRVLSQVNPVEFSKTIQKISDKIVSPKNQVIPDGNNLTSFLWSEASSSLYPELSVKISGKVSSPKSSKSSSSSSSSSSSEQSPLTMEKLIS
ncbi:MAG TPA: hypothetical protein V6C58_14130 [Allocoleopsis sp.]